MRLGVTKLIEVKLISISIFTGAFGLDLGVRNKLRRIIHSILHQKVKKKAHHNTFRSDQGF